MGLTPHQQEKMEALLNAIDSGLNRVVLTGSAGVGKTYLVKTLLEIFDSERGEIFITAPTHKALAVLKSKIDTADNLEFSTIHSALKLKRKFKPDGKVFFKQEFDSRFPPFERCKLLIIDEASMLNEDILGNLKQYHFPIVFIGDEKQINPVKEENSPVFHQHWFTVELTEIIRQGEGNPIIDLSRNLPLMWHKTSNLTSKKQGYLFTEDRKKVIEKLAAVNGTDELKYLAWTNEEVDAINQSVRHLIYGDNPAMIEQGEILVLNSPYSGKDKKEYYTNQEIEIGTLSIMNKRCYPPGLAPFDMKVYYINESIFAVHENSLNFHKQICKEIKSLANSKQIKWVDYYHYIESFADFTYNHAITIHKSQGSTYKDVIVNVENTNRNRDKKEKQRLFYTAVTRASELLILYNV